MLLGRCGRLERLCELHEFRGFTPVPAEMFTPMFSVNHPAWSRPLGSEQYEPVVAATANGVDPAMGVATSVHSSELNSIAPSGIGRDRKLWHGIAIARLSAYSTRIIRVGSCGSASAPNTRTWNPDGSLLTDGVSGGWRSTSPSGREGKVIPISTGGSPVTAGTEPPSGSTGDDGWSVASAAGLRSVLRVAWRVANPPRPITTIAAAPTRANRRRCGCSLAWMVLLLWAIRMR